MSALGPNITPNGLDNDGNRAINIADPVNAQDAATKAFSSNANNLTSGTISSAVSGGGYPTSAVWTTTWDMTALKDLGSFTVNTALALHSSSSGAIAWGRTQATLIGDGNSAHVPTVDGKALTNYNYAAGVANKVSLENVGGYKYWTCSSQAGAIL